MQSFVPRPQHGPAAQHALGRAGEQRIVGDQDAHAGLEAGALHAAADHQPEHHERLTDFVFDVHQGAAVGEQQLQSVACVALGMHRPVVLSCCNVFGHVTIDSTYKCQNSVTQLAQLTATARPKGSIATIRGA